jgi:hypothetical protein
MEWNGRKKMKNSLKPKIATILLTLLMLLVSDVQSQETKSDATTDNQVKPAQSPPPETVPAVLKEAAQAEPVIKVNPAKEEKASAGEPVEKPLRVSGDASIRYRLQANKDETDQDFYGVLQFQVDNIVPDKVSFSFYGMGLWDVGGDQFKARNQTAWYRDIYDSYDSSVQGRLYHAYLTLDGVLPNTLFMLGRQTRYLDTAYDFDGAYGEMRLFNDMLKLSAFGGATVYPFKGPRGGDWLAGGGAEIAPIPGTKFSVDGVYVAEDAKDEGLDDYEVIFRLKQKVWQQCYLLGQFTVLNDDAKDASFTASCNLTDYDVKLKFRFYALINEINNQTSSLARFLGAYKPYHQYDLTIAKNLGEYFILSGGYTARLLGHKRDEGSFNREFHRFHATIAADNWPVPDLEASVTFKGWVTEGNNISQDDLWGVDAEVGYTYEKVKASVGIAYELFKYEQFDDLQKERVGLTTLYTRLKYQITDMFSCFGEFGWEYDEERDFYNIELGVQAKF